MAFAVLEEPPVFSESLSVHEGAAIKTGSAIADPERVPSIEKQSSLWLTSHLGVTASLMESALCIDQLGDQRGECRRERGPGCEYCVASEDNPSKPKRRAETAMT